MEATMTKIYDYAIQYGMSLLAAVLIFIIGKWVAVVISRLVEKTMEKAQVEKTLAIFCRNMVFYGVMIFVILAALGKLGVQTTSFVAIIGAAGLAVGLALQGSLANFASGVLLIMFRPFKVGDMIEAGGAAGVVQEIQIFSTVIHTVDNKKVIVPNAKITGDKIIIHLVK